MELRGGGELPGHLQHWFLLVVMQGVELVSAWGTSAADCFPLQRAEKGKGQG